MFLINLLNYCYTIYFSDIIVSQLPLAQCHISITDIDILERCFWAQGGYSLLTLLRGGTMIINPFFHNM